MNIKDYRKINSEAGLFWVLMLAFCVFNAVAVWADSITLYIVDIAMPAGLWAHLFTLLIIGVMTRYFGFVKAKKLLLLGLLTSAIFYSYGQMVIALPNPGYPTKNALFDVLFKIHFYHFFIIQVICLISQFFVMLFVDKCYFSKAQLNSNKGENISFNVGKRQGKTLLWAFILAYAFAVLMGNWFDPRQINVFGLYTGGGSIAFPFTFVIADVITEVYGYRYTRFAIWVSLFFYLLLLIYGNLFLPLVPAGTNQHQALKLFFHVNFHVLLGASVVYLVSETLNARIVAFLREKTKGQYIGIRFLISTMTAYLLEELMYAPIAFQGLLRIQDLIQHMLHSWLFMVTIELCLIPLAVRLVGKIKRIESKHNESYSFAASSPWLKKGV